MPDWLSALKSSLTPLWTWLQSHPFAWIQSNALLSTLIALVLAFGKKVWSKLEPKAVDLIAQSVEHRIAVVLTGYRKLYAKHLYYKHRTFDVKGFSTQGKFALELENVYVDLDVDPAALGAISQDPLRLPKDAENSPDRSIFIWLNADPAHPRNFAIVGPPGSGKTTLLKHLALLLADRKAPIRHTPVLLFLRDHAAAIGTNPEVKLTELIETSLKDLPPPKGWFNHRIQKGKCLMMLDGLDEVADPDLRRKVVRWVEHQVEFLGANRFLVSSRPNGYRDNPLSGFTALEVLPFKPAQVERFVRNWYLANEVVAHQKNDPGVRMEADKGANELLDRLRRSPALQDLAVNPLLLTLIATVHRYHSQLPGRRVELFAEICDVFLGKRQQAKGLELDLTPAQKIRVLRVLAYEMMCREVREIKGSEASELIAPVLKLVAPNTEPATFLRMIEDSSALLVQKESGVYGFAHLTFQEYLASFHIKEEKLAEQLISHVDQTWWHETARLYAAQADASAIVERCLEQGHQSMEALLLATDCEQEALELRHDLRDRLLSITEGAVEDTDPDRRRHAAEYLLERRLRDMVRIGDDRYVDRSPVTHAEYQLFIDEMRAQGEHRQPDHWRAYQFAPGTGRKPIVGLRKSDAAAFCHWLTARKPGFWSYSLPPRNDLQTLCRSGRAWQGLCFFSNDKDRETFPTLPWNEIRAQAENDRGWTTASFTLRSNWLLLYVALQTASSLRVLARGLDLDLYHVLDRNLDCAGDLDLALARDRALARAHALQLASDLARALAHARALDLDLARALDRDLGRALDLDLDLARDLARALDVDRDLARVNAAFVLNWLCVVEKRANGELPINQALWIARTRQQLAADTDPLNRYSSKASPS